MFSLTSKKQLCKQPISPNVLSLKDTAGQERFHALGPIYYRDADAALLVYDITDNDTFVRVRKWVKELQQMASKNIIMAIAANKSDLIRSKKFDLQEAESYAASIGARLFVTSAKFGTGIDEVFLHIATSLVQLKKENGEFSATPPRKGMLIVDDEPELEPQPKCCT
uniref:Ras-related protein Rab-21 n=1 Tax=Anthurium amnicola TaxID=1678845 RepID=A0A1D1Z218_9ARAE